MTVHSPRISLILLAPAVAMTIGCADAANSPEPPNPPPVVAPLYDRIIFSRYDPASCNPAPCALSLWTAKADGSDLRLLVDSLNWPESPVVSPDGSTVVFENWGRLYMVNAAGKKKHELVTGLGESNFNPRWSPDGQWILFQGYDAPSQTIQVFRIHPNGTGLDRLTDASLPSAFGADWSPDGTRIVYVRQSVDTVCCNNPRWAITMDLATRTETVVVDSSTGFDGSQSAWSPDGTTIVFLGSNQNQWAILRLDVASGTYGFMADAQGNRPAIWSPDGTTLLYGTGDLWLMDADGGNQRPILADGMVNFEAFWTPAAPSP